MCLDPVTAVSGALAVGGAGLNLFGASQSAQGAKDAANATAFGANLAAQTADINAKLALQEGTQKLGAIDTKVQRAIGATRAAAGGANIDANSGSPLMMQVFSAMQGNVDKQLTIAGSENEAAGQYFAAAQDRFKASDALRAGQLGAGTAWLTGATGAVKSLAGFGGFSRGSGGFNFGFGS